MFNNLISHVNNSDTKWTVVGWQRQGLAHDASASAADDNQVLAEKATLHFELIVPMTITKQDLCNTSLVKSA